MELQQAAFNPVSNCRKQEPIIGKNRNTFAKMQREKLKKFKAEEKRQRRLNRKTESLLESNTKGTAEEESTEREPTSESSRQDDD